LMGLPRDRTDGINPVWYFLATLLGRVEQICTPRWGWFSAKTGRLGLPGTGWEELAGQPVGGPGFRVTRGPGAPAPGPGGIGFLGKLGCGRGGGRRDGEGVRGTLGGPGARKEILFAVRGDGLTPGSPVRRTGDTGSGGPRA